MSHMVSAAFLGDHLVNLAPQEYVPPQEKASVLSFTSKGPSIEKRPVNLTPSTYSYASAVKAKAAPSTSHSVYPGVGEARKNCGELNLPKTARNLKTFEGVEKAKRTLADRISSPRPSKRQRSEDSSSPQDGSGSTSEAGSPPRPSLVLETGTGMHRGRPTRPHRRHSDELDVPSSTMVCEEGLLMGPESPSVLPAMEGLDGYASDAVSLGDEGSLFNEPLDHREETFRKIRSGELPDPYSPDRSDYGDSDVELDTTTGCIDDEYVHPPSFRKHLTNKSCSQSLRLNMDKLDDDVYLEFTCALKYFAMNFVIEPTALKCDKANCISCKKASSKHMWMMDSGASMHVTPARSDFITYTEVQNSPMIQTAAKSTTLSIKGVGSVRLSHLIRDEHGNYREVETVFEPVYHVPQVSQRLFSLGTELGYSGRNVWGNSEMIGVDNDDGSNIVICQPLHKGDSLYWLFGAKQNIQLHAQSSVNIPASYEVMHKHFGHPSREVLKRAKTHTKNFPLNVEIPNQNPLCHGCAKGKMT